jgi:hypothetical protein
MVYRDLQKLERVFRQEDPHFTNLGWYIARGDLP